MSYNISHTQLPGRITGIHLSDANEPKIAIIFYIVLKQNLLPTI